MAVAATLGCAVGVATASRHSSDNARTMVAMNSGKYRMWTDDYGNLWCGGTCGGLRLRDVPIIDPVAS